MRRAFFFGVVLAACGEPKAAPAPLPVPSIETPPPTPARRFRTEPIFDGDALVIPRATVCVPEGADGPLPVLYALDGDYFVDELDLCGRVDELVRAHVIAPWVVVSVGSTEMRTEMLAVHPEDLARTILDELEPLVAAEVALARDRSHRAVLGYSYGGLAAGCFALARPEDFGRIVMMSPSLWFAGRRTLDAFRRAQQLPIRLYVDVGAREGEPDEVVPYMVADARALVGIVRMRDMQFGRDVALREIPGQAHDMALAASRLPGALRFALGDESFDDAQPTSVSIDLFEPPSPRAPTTFSIDARYASGMILSWPVDLAEVWMDGRRMDAARVPPGHRPSWARVRGRATDDDPRAARAY